MLLELLLAIFVILTLVLVGKYVIWPMISSQVGELLVQYGETRNDLVTAVKLFGKYVISPWIKSKFSKVLLRFGRKKHYHQLPCSENHQPESKILVEGKRDKLKKKAELIKKNMKKGLEVAWTAIKALSGIQ